MTDSYPDIEISVNREKKIFLLILAIAVIIRLFFVFAIPAWHSADEYPHYWYAEEIAQTGNLPVSDGTFPIYESFQPPLYYLTVSMPLLIFDDRLSFSEQLETATIQLILVRLLSLLAAIFTIIITYKICKNISVLNASERLSAVAFVSFLPTFAGVGATVNNDSLVTLIAAASLYYILKKKLDGRDIFLAGLFAGLALLTKLNAVILIPVIIFQLLQIEDNNQRKITNKLGIMIGGFSIGASLLIVFYLTQYNQLIVVNPGVEGEFGFSISELIRNFRNLIWSFWLAFGRSYRVTPAPIVYLITILPLMLIAGYGWIVTSENKRKFIKTIMIAVITGVIASLIYTASYPAGVMTSWGKNLYPLLPLIAIFFAVGWGAIPIARRNFALPLIAITTMIAGSIWVLNTMLSFY